MSPGPPPPELLDRVAPCEPWHCADPRGPAVAHAGTGLGLRRAALRRACGARTRGGVNRVPGRAFNRSAAGSDRALTNGLPSSPCAVRRRSHGGRLFTGARSLGVSWRNAPPVQRNSRAAAALLFLSETAAMTAMDPTPRRCSR